MPFYACKFTSSISAFGERVIYSNGSQPLFVVWAHLVKWFILIIDVIDGSSDRTLKTAYNAQRTHSELAETQRNANRHRIHAHRTRHSQLFLFSKGSNRGHTLHIWHLCVRARARVRWRRVQTNAKLKMSVFRKR